jgi:aspartate racemase
MARIRARRQADGSTRYTAIIRIRKGALERGGAEVIILATNTMHKLASQMMVGVNAPFIHIADATAKAINERGLRRPGLMATAFAIQQSFFTERLIAAGLNPVLPGR